jgi:formylglycine-generating enzyme required for sulfatase activity
MSKSLILLFLVLLITFSFQPQDFTSYTEKIPNTNQAVDMIAIQGGDFLIGSPETEALRRDDEGPQKKVVISPFWMSKYEVTWDNYLVFQNKELETKVISAPKVDAVARPTKPYVEMSFGQGKLGGFPVCNVTQFAARQFCKWLYEKTGNFYRLPTEAEWEYAARAGSKTPYYFGEAGEQLGDYAWFFENSDGAYKKVGLKKPNAWGLYDMYGNVAEWTSDQYVADFYGKLTDGSKDPANKAVTLYPHTIKGGHWDDDAEMLRSASRRPSTIRLKQRDPQIPKSDWWLTDAPFLGFRVVRPLNPPSAKEIEEYFARPPKDM